MPVLNSPHLTRVSAPDNFYTVIQFINCCDYSDFNFVLLKKQNKN